MRTTEISVRFFKKILSERCCLLFASEQVRTEARNLW